MRNFLKLNNVRRHIVIYSFLALGFLLKEIGAAFDVSYHFKYFREFYQMPHIINGAGDMLVVAMFLYLWYCEPSAARKQLNIIWQGLLVFILGIVFDQWYHSTFGVDLTTWSPAHITLYLGSLMATVGAALYVSRDYRHGHISSAVKKFYCLFFFVSIFSSFWFMLVQPEQAVVADYYLKHGVQIADPELLAAFFRTHANVYAGLPDWLYGAWAVMSIVLVFHLIKRLKFYAFDATIVATAYVAFRYVMNTLFIGIHYPTSTVPYFLLYISFLFDIIYMALKEKPLIRDIASSAMVLAGVVSMGFIVTPFPIHPSIPVIQTLILAIPSACMGYFIALWFYNKLFHKYI